jgi:hypothetical protein
MRYVPSGDCSKFSAVKPSLKTINMMAMPNPGSQSTIIKLDAFNKQSVEWLIMDITGSVVLEGNTNENNLQLNIAQLPAGAYMFYAKSNSAHGAVKIMKQ